MSGASRLAALAACTALLAAFGPGSAQAATINFATSSGVLGTSQAYGPVTAYSFTAPTSGTHKNELTATRQFGKNNGGGKAGLGLAPTSGHEINAPTGREAIVLDVSALLGQDIRIGFGSVQSAR